MKWVIEAVAFAIGLGCLLIGKRLLDSYADGTAAGVNR